MNLRQDKDAARLATVSLCVKVGKKNVLGEKKRDVIQTDSGKYEKREE